jgi:low affinity Fe/Cu permease
LWPVVTQQHTITLAQGVRFQGSAPARRDGFGNIRVQEQSVLNARFPAMRPYRSWLTWLGVSASHPGAFAFVGIYVALWVALDPHSFDWQSAATVAVWIMTLFIQRAEHRDTQAIHAKLDELLRANGEADDEIALLDHKEPEEIESHRDRALGPLNHPNDSARKRNPRDR